MAERAEYGHRELTGGAAHVAPYTGGRSDGGHVDGSHAAAVARVGLVIGLLLLGIMLLVIIIGPAFVNPYYDECVSQELVDVCYRLQFPTWEALLYLVQNVI